MDTEELLHVLVSTRLHHGALDMDCLRELNARLDQVALWELREFFSVFSDLLTVVDDHIMPGGSV